MYFIDTHTHLSDQWFAGEEDEAVSRALEAGVAKMIHPDVDSSERGAMLSLVKKHPGVLFAMRGLYPGSVDERWQEELDLVTGYSGGDIVAIGEIGLDYHEGRSFEKEQKEVFAAQLEYAARLGLPVNIHLRDATGDFLDILQARRHLGLRGNLHAFGGSSETFRQVSRTGDWYVGIGGVVTFKNASLAREIENIPLERIVLETDSPYLTPVPFRGKRNESAYIPYIAEKIALIKGVTTGEVARVTSLNAETLFHI